MGSSQNDRAVSSQDDRRKEGSKGNNKKDYCIYYQIMTWYFVSSQLDEEKHTRHASTWEDWERAFDA